MRESDLLLRAGEVLLSAACKSGDYDEAGLEHLE